LYRLRNPAPKVAGGSPIFFPRAAGTENENVSTDRWIAGRADAQRQTRLLARKIYAPSSPNGSQVIWSSNWGQPGDRLADLVARVSWVSTRLD